MNRKGFSQLIILLIAAGAALALGGGGFWYYQQPANQQPSVPQTQATPDSSSGEAASAPDEQTKQQTEGRDDLGCWPPSCSTIPDSLGRQACMDWKAGKAVQWPPDCKYLSAQPVCVKLCESEKKVGTQSGSPQIPNAPAQKQVFDTLPSLVKAEFAGGVSLEDKNVIIQGISAMDFYLKKWFSKSTDKPSGLRVGAGAPADEGSQSQVVVENGTTVILIETGSAVWSRQLQLNKEIGGEWRSRLAAHEYVHVYQFQNGCGEGVLTGRPVASKWFIEGEAEWLAFKAGKEAGLLPSFSIPQMVTPQAKQVKGSLESFESPTDLNLQAYFLYTMAIDYLMKDRPIKALDDFCANLGSGMSMPKAFETAFGITKEKFYEGFGAYRKTWSSESSSGQPSQGQIPQEYCSGFASVPSCSYVGSPDSQDYKYCKQCYPNK